MTARHPAVPRPTSAAPRRRRRAPGPGTPTTPYPASTRSAPSGSRGTAAVPSQVVAGRAPTATSTTSAGHRRPSASRHRRKGPATAGLPVTSRTPAAAYQGVVSAPTALPRATVSGAAAASTTVTSTPAAAATPATSAPIQPAPMTTSRAPGAVARAGRRRRRPCAGSRRRPSRAGGRRGPRRRSRRRPRGGHPRRSRRARRCAAPPGPVAGVPRRTSSASADTSTPSSSVSHAGSLRSSRCLDSGGRSYGARPSAPMRVRCPSKPCCRSAAAVCAPARPAPTTTTERTACPGDRTGSGRGGWRAPDNGSLRPGGRQMQQDDEARGAGRRRGSALDARAGGARAPWPRATASPSGGCASGSRRRSCWSSPPVVPVRSGARAGGAARPRGRGAGAASRSRTGRARCAVPSAGRGGPAAAGGSASGCSPSSSRPADRPPSPACRDRPSTCCEGAVPVLVTGRSSRSAARVGDHDLVVLERRVVLEDGVLDRVGRERAVGEAGDARAQERRDPEEP